MGLWELKNLSLTKCVFVATDETTAPLVGILCDCTWMPAVFPTTWTPGWCDVLEIPTQAHRHWTFHLSLSLDAHHRRLSTSECPTKAFSTSAGLMWYQGCDKPILNLVLWRVTPPVDTEGGHHRMLETQHLPMFGDQNVKTWTFYVKTTSLNSSLGCLTLNLVREEEGHFVLTGLWVLGKAVSPSARL
jgi:hypothetical protein